MRIDRPSLPWLLPPAAAAALAVAAAAAFAPAAAASSSAPPPLAALDRPGQLAFAAQTRPRGYGSLLQLEYEHRHALEQAVQRFEAQDADVWFAGKRSRTGEVESDDGRRVGWHAVVRHDVDSVQDALETAAQAGAVSGTAVPVEDLLVANPTLSTLYSQTLSAASIANLTERVHADEPVSLDDPIHNTYHPYDSIHAILTEFQRAFPGWVEVTTLGQSSQGREIWAAKVTKPTKASTNPDRSPCHAEERTPDERGDDGDDAVRPTPLFSSLRKSRKHRKDKLKFVVAGTQHAREWIAASTALYLVHELVALDSQGKAANHELLEQVEFTFVPVVNVRVPLCSLRGARRSQWQEAWVRTDPLHSTARRLRLLVGARPPVAQITSTRPPVTSRRHHHLWRRRLRRDRPEPELGIQVPAGHAAEPVLGRVPGRARVRVG